MNENKTWAKERQDRVNILARSRVENLEAALAGRPYCPDYKFLPARKQAWP